MGINNLGLNLIELLLADRFYEEALDVFQELEPYIQGEKTVQFKVLRVNTEMQKLSPDQQLIESLLGQLSQADWVLIDGATYCFERDDYAMCLRILRFLFEEIPITAGDQPSSESILDFLETVLLQFNNGRINNEAWKAVWVFFSQCAINTMRPRRILKLEISYLSQLETSCRLEVSLSRANALSHISRLE